MRLHRKLLKSVDAIKPISFHGEVFVAQVDLDNLLNVFHNSRSLSIKRKLFSKMLGWHNQGVMISGKNSKNTTGAHLISMEELLDDLNTEIKFSEMAQKQRIKQVA